MAVIATVVIYVALAVLMVTMVRPVLAPRVFVPASTDENALRVPDQFLPWELGTAYRFVPGSQVHSHDSATEIGARCLSKNPGQVIDGTFPSPNFAAPSLAACFASQHVQYGGVYIPYRSFWLLQWREEL